jgi:RNA polymerase sigma-70 factor (ECF subfamily)
METGTGDTSAEAGAVSAAVATARARWPELSVDEGAFLERFVRQLPEEDRARAAADWHVEDLYLAFACGRGDAAALRVFERDLLAKLPAFLARLAPTPSFVDEARQVLRAKLFVADEGARPKIDAYSGRGALEGWLRIVAVNTALKMLRKTEPPAEQVEGAAARACAPGADPEVEYMKHRYRAEFEAALREAFAALGTRERNVLRLHFIDGLNIDGIGAAYGTHRATAARWLAAARATLLNETRRALRAKLKLTPAEFESMVALVQSRLEVSVRALLA